MWKWTRKDCPEPLSLRRYRRLPETIPAPVAQPASRLLQCAPIDRPAPIPSAVPPVRSVPSEESVLAVLGLQSVESFRPDVTHIGKSIVIKGDVSGSGDVYLDGELEGSVELLDGNFTVGSEGCIRANLQARSIVVQGRVDGNLYGLERAELKKSATVVGDICTPRIAIEDGAFLEGNVRVHKDIPQPQTKKEDAAARCQST
jgi:cytoskeletal protein CcmA (bactofilin family)